MIHIEACLKNAISAAEILNVDSAFVEEWRERLAKLAPPDGPSEWEPLPEAFEEIHQQRNPPEFRPAEWHRYPHRYPFDKRWWNWIQFLPWSLLRDIRGGQFSSEKDFDGLIRVLKRWRHPNGLLWPMPTRFWGRQGPMTESLGILAPIQEMLLESWRGIIEIFPAWPKRLDANFANLRAEKAFLVSATLKNEEVENASVKSLAGAECAVRNPWHPEKARLSSDMEDVVPFETDGDVLRFQTKTNALYSLTKTAE